MKNHGRNKAKGLTLHRPIAFIDLEATGIFPDSDRIVEIGILKVRPDGKAFRLRRRVKPDIRIPKEAIRVHGITNRDVADKPGFKQIGRRVKRFIRDCDLAGFNLRNFDLPMLQAEFDRAGIEFSSDGRHVIDVKEIYHHHERRRLTDAVQFYCHEEHQEAHSALEDARATWKVLKAQVEKYHLPRSTRKLANFMETARSNSYLDSDCWFIPRDGKPVFAKRKHRGKSLLEVAETEPDYLQWMLEQTDIPDDTKQIVQQVLD